MSDEGILEELEKEFESIKTDSWEPDVSFSGAGSQITGPFESPGGFVIIDVTLEDGDRYEITAVDESAEDFQIQWAHQPTIDSGDLRNMQKGTYMLNVQPENGGEWEIDFYFTASEPVSLPISKSGSGGDFIGPINHSGFIKLEGRNYSDSQMKVVRRRSDGSASVSDELLYLDPVEVGENSTSSIKVGSNQEGRTHYPWISIDCEGEWELELTPQS